MLINTTMGKIFYRIALLSFFSFAIFSLDLAADDTGRAKTLCIYFESCVHIVVSLRDFCRLIRETFHYDNFDRGGEAVSFISKEF